MDEKGFSHKKEIILTPMSLKIILFANYREIAGKKDIIIDEPFTSVKDVVEHLTGLYPGLAPLMFKEGELNRYVNILINGVSIREMDGLLSSVHDGSEIKMFPPVSGG